MYTTGPVWSAEDNLQVFILSLYHLVDLRDQNSSRKLFRLSAVMN